MAQPKLLIKCRHCDGIGQIELTGVYAETARLVAKHPGRNGAQLAAIAGCQPTAMNNRLARLALHGIVEGETHGRQIIWRRRTTLRGTKARK